MNKAEIRMAKRKLESYKDNLKLAEQQEAEVIRLQELYERKAGARCIPIDRNDCGRNSGAKSDVTSMYHEIFSKQKEANLNALEYKTQADLARRFIERVVDPMDKEGAEYMRMVYLNGMQFTAISERIGCPVSTIRSRIDSCLGNISSSVARCAGIL